VLKQDEGVKNGLLFYYIISVVHEAEIVNQKNLFEQEIGEGFFAFYY
jgi:hypothetical protein